MGRRLIQYHHPTKKVSSRLRLATGLCTCPEYSPDGGAITIRLWHTEEQIQLTVTDHGIGIPASDRAHISDRFHRGRNVDDRRFAGMGLGLYLCHAIVEQHSGQITVTDTVPQGATFHIVLPYRPEGAVL